MILTSCCGPICRSRGVAFFWLMVFFVGVSLIVGGYFWALGAWPVFGFFGLDIVLLYGAFRLNYRYGDRESVVEGKRVDLGGRRIIQKK